MPDWLLISSGCAGGVARSARRPVRRRASFERMSPGRASTVDGRVPPVVPVLACTIVVGAVVIDDRDDAARDPAAHEHAARAATDRDLPTPRAAGRRRFRCGYERRARVQPSRTGGDGIRAGRERWGEPATTRRVGPRRSAHRRAAGLDPCSLPASETFHESSFRQLHRHSGTSTLGGIDTVRGSSTHKAAEACSRLGVT